MRNSSSASFLVGGENSAGRYVYFQVRGCADARAAVEVVVGMGFTGASVVTRDEFGDREYRRIARDAEIIQ